MASILSKNQKKKQDYTLKELKSLGSDLLSSRAHIKNLPLLLSFISPESPPQFVVESLLSLQSFFTPLLSQLPSTSSSSSTKRPRSEEDDDDTSNKKTDEDPEVIFNAWLRSKLDEFVKLLLDVLVSQQSEDTLRDIVLGTLMEFVKLLNAGRFHSSIFHRILNAIIHSAVDIDVFLDILTSKYVKYIDVRYFTYISMEKFVKTLEASAVVSADRTVIEHSETENESKDSDFLTKSYDIGGVVSVMALSSLFILMTEHGLEYPNFYEKLYALLVPSVFVAKHRARFLQLLDACLRSSLLPAYLAASFAKKLSRLSLSVPPSGSLVITALIYNLLRRHPTINHLVHQETVETANEANSEADEPNECRPKTNKNLGIDYFNNQESDLKKTGAMRSSLWEIDTLRHHYCPPVSRFVSSLETDLTIRAKTTEMKIEDFSSGSYATIFGDEVMQLYGSYAETPCCN
uniref:CCAAT-binding factor domain-containing protein n=1 Tax=Brassica campestris TaxID=3711 RepID=M4CCV5_BRACM